MEEYSIADELLAVQNLLSAQEGRNAGHYSSLPGSVILDNAQNGKHDGGAAALNRKSIIFRQFQTKAQRIMFASTRKHILTPRYVFRMPTRLRLRMAMTRTRAGTCHCHS